MYFSVYVITHGEGPYRSFANDVSALQNLVDVGFSTLLAMLGVPRADIRKLSAGIALSGSRRVLRSLCAHSCAVVDYVVLEKPQL